MDYNILLFRTEESCSTNRPPCMTFNLQKVLKWFFEKDMQFFGIQFEITPDKH